MKNYIGLVYFVNAGNGIGRRITPAAASSVLMEASTGKILYEKQSNDQLAPASMTKLMTMLLIMETLESGKITLNDEVLISHNAAIWVAVKFF